MNLKCALGFHDPVSSGVPESGLAPESLTCRRCGDVRYVYAHWRTHWRTPEAWERIHSSDLRGRS